MEFPFNPLFTKSVHLIYKFCFQGKFLDIEFRWIYNFDICCGLIGRSALDYPRLVYITLDYPSPAGSNIFLIDNRKRTKEKEH